MERIEMVEKLRDRANVSYEEAKNALEACDWDLLDAMVYLEKLGRTAAPKHETFTAGPEPADETPSVRTIVDDQNRKASHKEFRQKIKDGGRKIWQKLRDNSFHVSRKGNEILKVPAFVLVIALLAIWKLLAPVMIIALFFGVRYSFSGKDDLGKANEMMNKAGNLADEVAEKIKNEYDKL